MAKTNLNATQPHITTEALKKKLMGASALTLPVLSFLVSMTLPGVAGAVDPTATPTGENVLSGGITTERPYDGRLNVHQSTNKALIEWDSFDIGTNAWTQFYQPNSSAIAVNRVVGAGNDPTQILGTLKANGNIMVLDRNGVFFGKDARIDVGGIVASTGNIDDQKFISEGTIQLSDFGDASVENQGMITVAEGGLAALVAPTVVNNGIITAKMGRVELAAGNTQATVDLYGDGLVEFAVTDDAKKAVVNNSGVIDAEGGVIAMTTGGAKAVVDSVINMSGVASAKTVSIKGGKIVLGGKVTGTGDNAKIDVIAENTTEFTGTIEAGDNAEIEVSGHDLKLGGDFVVGEGANITFDPVTLTIGAAEAATIVSAMGSGSGSTVYVEAEEQIILNAAIDTTGGANNTNTLNFSDQGGAAGLQIDLNNTITLRSNQKLTGDGTVVNVANTGRIQNGLDVAASGATVNVAAGTYNQTASINITKAVNLRGAQAGVDARQETGLRTYDGVGESIINLGGSRQVLVKSDNVTIDGFQIQNSSADMIYADTVIGADGVAGRDANSNGSWDNVSVLNNLIRNGGDEGVQLRDTTNANLQYNNITNTSGDALNLADASTNGFIQDNEIYGTSSDNAQIYIYNSNNITVQGNYIHDIVAPSNDGIKMGNKDGSDGNKIIGNVLNNRISNITQDGIAIYSSNSLVSGNEISGSSSSNGAIHINVKDAGDPFPNNIVIENNNIHDNWTRGVQVNRATNVTVRNNTFNNNSNHVSIGGLGNAAQTTVAGNSFGASTGSAVINSGTNTLKADDNWWNTTDDAAVQARTTGLVDFSTYLGLGTDTDGGTSGFQGDYSNLFVTNLGAQTGAGTRINDAITTLADGSLTGGARLVNVTDGTYAENVIVNKSMTLQGAGSALTVIDGTGLNGHGITVAADDVSLEGMIVQNFTTSYLASGVYIDTAISNLSLNDIVARNNIIGMYVYTTGSIDGLDIDNSGFNNNDYGLYTHKDMSVLNSPDTVTNVTVDDTAFNNNRYKGIYLEKLSNATFTNIDVIGSAYDPANVNANVAIEANLKNGAYDNIMFDDVTVSGGSPTPTLGGKAGVGISVKARNDGPTYSAKPATLTNVIITNSNIDVSNGDIAVAISHGVSGATVQDSTLTGPQGVTVFNGASDITVEGNTINTQGAGGAGTIDGSVASVHGVGLFGAGGTNTVRDNMITGSGEGTGVLSVASNDVMIGGATVADGNTVSGYKNGVRVNNGVGSTEIQNNTISGNTDTGAGQLGSNYTTGMGILLDSTTQATISDNTVSGNSHGIRLLNSDAASLGDIVVSGNTVTGNAGHGIISKYSDNLQISENTSTGNNIGVYLDGSNGVSIDANTISNNTQDGLRLRDGSNNASITQNVIANNGGSAVFVDNTFAANSGVTVTGNNIQGATLISNQSPATVDARGNWWGTADQNTINGKMAGSVDFSTYLGFGIDLNPGATGFQADYSDLFVTTLGAHVGGGRITGSIALLADGSLTGASRMIHVMAGNYGENVVINKAANVRGWQADVAAAGRVGPEAQVNSVTISADDVTLNGFKIDGASNGVTINGNDATVAYNVINNSGVFGVYAGAGNGATIRDNAITGLGVGGAGVGLSGHSGATIADNTIDVGGTAGADGLWIVGGSNNTDISGNVVTNAGRNGITLGAVTGTDIDGNTIENSASNGVFIDGTSTVVSFTDNFFKNNGQHINYQNGAGADLDARSASGNQFWTGAAYELTGDMDIAELFALEGQITHKMDNAAYGRVLFGDGLYVSGGSIQSAIDIANVGDTVNVDNGTYTEDLVIWVEDLKLTGHGTTLQSAGGANLITITADGVNIDPFVFDGFGAAQYGIFNNGASNLVIDGNTFQNFTQGGVRLDNNTDALITGNTFNNTGIYGVLLNGGTGATIEGGSIANTVWDSIRVIGSADTTIQNISLSNAGTVNGVNGVGSGIVFVNANGARVENANIHDIARIGIYAGASSDIELVNNTLTNIGTGTNTSYGDSIGQWAGIHIEGTNNLTATGNTITGTTGDGINLGSLINVPFSGPVTGTVVLAGNSVTNAGRDGLRAATSNGMDLGAFTATGTTGLGVNITNTGNGMTISGDVDTNGAEIVISSTGGLLELAQNQTITSDGANITLGGGTGGVNLRGSTNAGTGDLTVTGRHINFANNGTTTAEQLTLTANTHNITQSAPHTINANTLTGSSGRETALDGPNNHIVNLGAFSVGSVVNTSGFTLIDADGGLNITGNVSTQGGDVNVTTTGGLLELAQNQTVSSNGGNISYVNGTNNVNLRGSSNAGTGDITVTGRGINFGNNGTTTADQLTLTANTHNITQSAPHTIIANTLTGSSGRETALDGPNNLIETLGTFATGTVVAAGNGFTLNDSDGGLTIAGNVSTQGGDIDIDTAKGDLIVNGGVSITSNGGSISLTANDPDVVFNGVINAGAGDVNLSGDNVYLNGGSSITGGTLTTTAVLGFVAQESGAVLDVAKLTGSAASYANFGGDNNLIDTLGAFATGTPGTDVGGFTLENAQSLDVDGAVTTEGGNVDIDVTGDMALLSGGSIDAKGGNIDLNQSGVFSAVDADSVSTTGSGTITMIQRNGGSIGNAIRAMNNTGNGLNTLTVGAGTYNESVLVDQANLLLLGANAGITGFGARGAESQVNPNSPGFHIVADNVTLDGFAVAGASGADGYGVWVDNADNAVIRNNVIGTSEQAGIRIQGSDNADVFSNALNANGIGVEVRNSTNVDVGAGTLGTDPLRNVITNSVTDGVKVRNGENIFVINNTINGSGEDGVDMRQATGNAEIRYNRVTGTTTGDGVHVRGIDNAQITNNALGGIGRDGVHAQGGQSVDILNNTVTGTTSVAGAGNHGIYVLNGSEAVISGNTIAGANATGGANGRAGALQDGIHVENNEDVSISGNTIRGGNAQGSLFGTDRNGGIGAGNHGIYVGGSNDAIVSSNNILGGNGHLFGGNRGFGAGNDGVHVVDSNRANVNGNTTNYTTNDGIEVATSNNADITGNTVTNAGGNGIAVAGGNNVDITGNFIGDGLVAGAALDGINVNGGRSVTIDGNIIRGGLLFAAGAGDNGIEVVDNREATITNNQILGGAIVARGAVNNGIYVSNSGAQGNVNRNGVVITDNVVTGWAFSNGAGDDGIYVINSGAGTAGAAADISRNTVSYAGDDGIEVVDTFHAHIYDNTLTDIDDTGIVLSNTDEVDVWLNTIDDAETGIALLNSGTDDATIDENTITNVDTGIFADGVSNLNIEDNILDGRTGGGDGDYGIYVANSAGARIGGNGDGNTVEDFETGIYVSGSDSARVAWNDITEFDDYGVFVSGGNDVRVRRNTIHDANGVGIRAEGSDDLRIRRNTLTNLEDNGIEVSGGLSADIVLNTLTNIIDAIGIDVDGNDGVLVAENTLHNDPGIVSSVGIQVSNSNNAHIGEDLVLGFAGNTVSTGSEAAIRVNGGDSVDVAGNDLTDGTDADDLADYGVEMNGSTNSFVVGNTITGRNVAVNFEGGDGNEASFNIIDGNGTGIRVSNALNTRILNHATLTNSSVAGIEVTGTSDGTVIDNNLIENSAIGILTSGSDVGTATLTNNTLSGNNTGIRLESGLIDLSSLTDGNEIFGGDTGLQMAPLPGFEGNLVLAGNTLGSTRFVNPTSWFIRLEDGAYFVGGTPFVIDALNVSFTNASLTDFIPANSPYGPGILTLSQLQALENMIFDLDDSVGRGQIFVGLVPGLDESDLFPNGLGTFGTPGAGFQLTILGLPTVPGVAGNTNLGAFLNSLTPFAGGEGNPEDLANISPAAGGSASDLNAIAPASGENINCWAQMGGVGANAAVSYNFSNSSADALEAAANCGG